MSEECDVAHLDGSRIARGGLMLSMITNLLASTMQPCLRYHELVLFSFASSSFGPERSERYCSVRE